MAKKFYIAPTRISQYFGCPRKYLLGTQYRYTGRVAKALIQGTQFHALMEGDDVPDATEKIIHMAKQTKLWMRRKGYEIIGGEVLETVSIPKTSYMLSRKIDAYCILDGMPVLVDYKTANYNWKKLKGMYPQGMGFQADAYLIPPSDEEFNPFGEGIWPEEIHFIVATDKKVMAVPYSATEESYNNLINAISLIHEAEKYPKNVGYGCTIGDTGCEYYSACFQVDGWETSYEKKGKRK